MTLEDYLSHLERVLIIHHWDTDGICSTSLVKDALKGAEVTNRVPRIGTYRFSQRILHEAAENWDAIIVVDIRPPDDDFKSLREVAGCKILLLDHHIGKTPDGVVRLQPEHEKTIASEWPSTSWLVKATLGLPTNLRSILGVVGDKGSIDLSEGPERDDAMQFLSNQRVDEGVLRHISDLLDSNSRVGQESLVERAVADVSKIGENAEALLTHPVWIKNARSLEIEIGRQLEQPGEAYDRVAIKKFDSRLDIVSAVARKLAWSGKWRVVVAANGGFLPDQEQIYVRRGTGIIDAPAIIQMAHQRGYSAGGKEEVVGIVVPKNQSDEFLQHLVSKLAA